MLTERRVPKELTLVMSNLGVNILTADPKTIWQKCKP